MKAIIYGPSNTLQLAEIDKPVPADDEVLIKVRASSVNPFDCGLLKAAPFMRNLTYAVLRARVKRPGVDVAGEIEVVGRNVTWFAPGDAVFGGAVGAFSEYACTSETRLAKKPANVSFEDAACMNIAGRTALQGLRDIAGVEAGQKILINGASGGIGTLAVQIANWMGADVTGVCSTRNLDLVRGVGADRVIDYTREDFAKDGVPYDVIYDLVGDRPLLSLRSSLKPKGTYVGAGVLGSKASMIGLVAGMFNGSVLSLFTSQKFTSYVTKRGNDDLEILAGLIEAGNVRPVIDRTFRLEEAPEAVRYVDAKHARGKVVISIES